MMSLETFSLYVLLCILAPLVGAFTLAFTMIFENRFDYLQNAANTSKLEKELQYAQYYQLHQRIKPHFFFNTLNTLLSLARLDRKDELVSSLEVMSKFMKYNYQTNDKLVPLLDEVAYTNGYLDIQQLRFGHRVEIHQHIEKEAENAFILPFVLQTMVENTFKHAFEKYPGQAVLKIIIFRDEQLLHVEVWNTHLKPSIHDDDNFSREDGLGVANIRERLQLLFPDSPATFDMHYAGAEACARIIIPYRESQQI
ncbi:sensor histidine kinase [Sporosarcina sp. NCCP-2716]|uniref:sensor histidine kinase n=1 Tax=Sporosarcina sp. NCCP-2716 TaxID=2943679 RepID=UPI00203D143C|nr:histidine kinase [Sporosarcina sp. NCCP-2716]GKV70567.1 sensor histidine kinase [Sporosarcina sp. NCCP-2716]